MKLKMNQKSIPARRLLTCLLLTLFVSSSLISRDTLLYKQADTVRLYLEVLYPGEMKPDRTYPAIVFFFGGGWVNGNRQHFVNHAVHFARRGAVCFLVDYRISSKHGTTPFVSLMDAKSAIRFVREHAADFQVDPDRIVASGGSAGGHLAAATALVEGYNDPSDDLSVECIPDALVLFNPVIDNGPGGYGYERVGEAYRDFSPLHNIHEGAPPTIFFLGTEDRLIPVETARYYRTVMERVGSRCDLHLYEGEGHGFFNFGRSGSYLKTLTLADQFLVSLGYLKPPVQ